MAITLLDVALLVVMLISALLAMVRGFMREILSIASWIAAALVSVWAYPRYLPTAKQYFTNDYVAGGAVVACAFLGTLILVSIFTIKLSDLILDSRVGALDRTLGFLFGLARGLVIVVVAFMFFDWFAPPKSQPTWVTGAKSQVVLRGTGEWLMSVLPDVEGLYAKYKQRKRDEQQEPADATPEQRSESGPLTTGSIGQRDVEPGYDRADREQMRQLLQTATPKR